MIIYEVSEPRKTPDIIDLQLDREEALIEQSRQEWKEACAILSGADLIREEVISLDTLHSMLVDRYPEHIQPSEEEFDRIATKMISALTVEECVSMLFCDDDDVLEYYRRNKE